jgi:hypothetical protein
MADSAQIQTSGLVIPPETLEKFGVLIALIKGSESMNTEERQYWINILPIMTPEQITNLTEILTNEKTQLAAIDAKYTKESPGSPAENAAAMEQSLKDKKMRREQTEKEELAQEEQTEADLLGKIQQM